jgi:hypothetical protein
MFEEKGRDQSPAPARMSAQYHLNFGNAKWGQGFGPADGLLAGV